MRRNKNSFNLAYQSIRGGYTIVEVLIFLAISSVLAISALMLMSGRQRNTEFTQAVNELESQLRDIANDVTTGYFPNPGNISCTVSGATDAPALSTGGADPGTNTSCIYVGRAIQFDSNSMRVYSALGRRQANGSDVKDVFESKPKLVAQKSAIDTAPNAIETLDIHPAIKVRRIRSISSAGTYDVSGIAFITTFGKTNSITSLASIRTDIAPLGPLGMTPDQYQFVSAFNDFFADQIPSLVTNKNIYNTVVNTDDGIEICVEGQGVDRHARIVLGAKKSDGSSTTIVIGNGSNCP